MAIRMDAVPPIAYPVGSLVRFRGRDWVVQGLDTARQLLTLKPLAGSDVETCTAYWPLVYERMTAAAVPPLSADALGDFVSGALLRDAARLAIRQAAGPLRAIGQTVVRPRPYQLVPLLMALKLDPVRLLIADDVGVGKTIEAALIAKELLERGDIQRTAVLCPPQLCDQWQAELASKFHIEAVVVRGSTIRQLEDALPSPTTSVFRHYPHLVISIDFIKGERHREAFLAQCPEFVIVDEAHGIAEPGDGTRQQGQHQRHALVARIAADSARHLVLLTATPHSGIQQAFASLMELLDPALGPQLRDNAAMDPATRARVARHFVQRRRGDVKRWLGDTAVFPTRVTREADYGLGAAYEKLFHDVWQFTRDLVREPGMSHTRQRVRYWAALALLRSVMSSPAAAVEALSRREQSEAVSDTWEADVLDDIRRRELLDGAQEDGAGDTIPQEAITAGVAETGDRGRRRLTALRQQAEALLAPDADPKLRKLVPLVDTMVQAGARPIIFCRFIATANYVAERLGQHFHQLKRGVEVVAVTGQMPDEERAHKVRELSRTPAHVLVATDCLSEGIDLQMGFDAVIHYDLPWNPNRLEQREGRVDRYGQAKAEVQAVLLYGHDNPIDAAVMQVLIRKARNIYQSLGITVPVPVESDAVLEALTEYFFREAPIQEQLTFDLGERSRITQLHGEWDRAAEREKESRSRFAQHALPPDAVEAVWQETDAVLGSPAVVERFLVRALPRWGVAVRQDTTGLAIQARDLDPFAPPGDRDAWVGVTTDPHGAVGAVTLDRSHPWVEGWSHRVLGTALGGADPTRVARSGAMLTTAVTRRTLIAIARIRYRVRERGHETFAEEVMVTGYQREHPENWVPNAAIWRDLADTAQPAQNLSVGERQEQVQWGLDMLTNDAVSAAIKQAREDHVTATYRALRASVGTGQVEVTAYDPDWLGCYVLLPGGMA